MGRKFDVGGYQRVQEIQWILVELCVFRIPEVETDLLITLSTSLQNEPMDIAFNSMKLRFSDEFQHVISSIRVCSWDLFGVD
jgi:hypothetical protein